MSARYRLLYVTDLAYAARGRVYRDEDLGLTARLAEHFDIALCAQPAAEALMDSFDAVVVRNSGPAIRHQAAYDAFRAAATERGVVVFNELTGRADMLGKQYLVDLSREGAAVILTIDRLADIGRLPPLAAYMVKLMLGSDSIGMSVVGAGELTGITFDGSVLLQPVIPFVNEVSFVFVDHEFHYALVAPDPARRWELELFDPSAADLEFARWFIEWNRIDHGIQRVDACRMANGELILMELEDHNPYLSLDLLDDDALDRFDRAMRDSIVALIER
ncbi:MAG: hypothetical protein JWM34_1255 [Ilumatobacteraceae bacterium]|nr:hypothetical protein [Ilumatobacteraceae bacterium]